MFSIMHLDNTVFKMHGDGFRWEDATENAERVAIFRMNFDRDTYEGYTPDTYDADLRKLLLRDRFQRMAKESPRALRGGFDAFLQHRYELLNAQTRTIKPRLTSNLRAIFPKDPPITVNAKGEMQSRDADKVAVASIISEQDADCIWITVQRAKLDQHFTQNRIVTPADFAQLPHMPNDLLGAMMDLAMRRQNAPGSKTTLVTDTDEGVEAGLRNGIQTIRRYTPPKWGKKGANIQKLTRFKGFTLH